MLSLRLPRTKYGCYSAATRPRVHARTSIRGRSTAIQVNKQQRMDKRDSLFPFLIFESLCILLPEQRGILAHAGHHSGTAHSLITAALTARHFARYTRPKRIHSKDSVIFPHPTNNPFFGCSGVVCHDAGLDVSPGRVRPPSAMLYSGTVCLTSVPRSLAIPLLLLAC